MYVQLHVHLYTKMYIIDFK